VTLATSKCFIDLLNKARWNAHSPNEILKRGFVSAASASFAALFSTPHPAKAMAVDLRNFRRVKAVKDITLVLNFQKNSVSGSLGRTSNLVAQITP
jgi:hypothetical protein